MKKALAWKQVSSKVLLTHPRIKIVEDEVELPNGKMTSYVRFAPGELRSVTAIAINASNKVLIQKEYNYPLNKVLWQLPGGAVGDDEDLLEALNRELAEESGYQAKTMKLLGSFYTNNRRSDQEQFVVLCTDLYKHSLQADEDEFIETYWLSRKEIEDRIAAGKFKNINLLAALNIWLHSV